MNVIKIVLSSLFGAGITFLTQIYLADRLDHTGYGVYASIMAYALVVVPLLTLGFEQYIYKYYIHKGNAVCYLKWFASLSILTLSALMLSVYLKYITLSVAVYFISQAWLLILLSLYQCAKDYSTFSITSFAIPLLRFGFIFIFIYMDAASISVVFDALLWSSILVAIYCAISCWLVAMKLDVQRESAGMTLRGDMKFRDAFDYAFASISFAIYFQGGVIFISRLLSYKEVAIFSAAYLIVTISYLLPSILFQKYIIPILHDKMNHFDSCKDIYVGLNFYSLILGCVVSVVMVVFSGLIINLFFNDTYDASVLILRYLSCAVLIKYMSSSAAAFMMTGGHIRVKNRIMVVSAMLNIVLCWFLIKHYGISGAII